MQSPHHFSLTEMPNTYKISHNKKALKTNKPEGPQHWKYICCSFLSSQKSWLCQSHPQYE